MVQLVSPFVLLHIVITKKMKCEMKQGRMAHTEYCSLHSACVSIHHAVCVLCRDRHMIPAFDLRRGFLQEL